MRLHLAQAFSNRAPRGRKHDFRDAERLVRRLVADELTLSFVPPPEQRAWRTITRMKVQLTEEKSRLHSQLECLLEEMRLKLSSVISDLLGASGYRILRALARGQTEAQRLADLGSDLLKCTKQQLLEVLTGDPQPVHCQLLTLSFRAFGPRNFMKMLSCSFSVSAYSLTLAFSTVSFRACWPAKLNENRSEL